MDAVIELVRQTLQEQDKVFLVTRLSSQNEWRRFCKGLSALGETYADTAFAFLLEEGVDRPERFRSITVSHEEARELCGLYFTYEFSDRFVVFSDNRQYGTIFNYADTGIVTEEEAVKAILG